MVAKGTSVTRMSWNEIADARAALARGGLDLKEKVWQQQAVGTRGNPGLARQLGWHAYHVLRSKGSEPGYPDWTLARNRLVFLELKTETGTVTPAQKEWIGWLLAAGVEVYVARPHHLQELARILKVRRWDDRDVTDAQRQARQQLDHDTRQEIAA